MSYRGKNDATKGLFGAPGSTIPGALDLDPKVKHSKRARRLLRAGTREVSREA